MRFSVVILLLFAGMQASTVRASTCAVATLDVYIAPGFSCTLGNLSFSSFAWSSNVIANGVSAANLPVAIAVTPQNGAGGTGFAFGNLGVSFTGSLSNVTSSVNFHAAPITGTITGSALSLGTHGATPPGGTDVAYFQDSAMAFLLSVADPQTFPAFAGSGVYQVVRTTDSATFAGMGGADFFSAASAVVLGFDGGTASVNGYTVLLSTTVATGPSAPEPGSLVLLIGGVALVAGLRRRGIMRGCRLI